VAEVVVDTDILLDLYTQDDVWEVRSAAAIASAADADVLVINPIIYAELSVGIEKIEEPDEFLGTDFRRDSLPWEAAYVAGKAFLAYRRRGGSKMAPLPDFYIGPRPAVIVQEDRFDQTSSITLCAFTTDLTDAPLLRMLIEPTDRNGLKSASRLTIDKITTVPKARLGERIGKLNDGDTVRLNRALTVFLGLAR